MSDCVTCGTPLHPERAEKYGYCTAPECQDKNATGLTMVAIGVNKSAEQFQVLDQRTREDAAKGEYHDQRRGSFGRSPDRVQAAAPPSEGSVPAGRRPGPASGGSRPVRTGHPAWSKRQENLARIYHAQGIRPDEIAHRLGLSDYQVTQLLLAITSQRGR